MNELTPQQELLLLELARRSIEHGLQHGAPLPVAAPALVGALGAPGACFVSLHRHGTLRGCIGSVEPRRALAIDTSENAFAAAFHDHRFAHLTAAELPGLMVSLYLLGPLQSLPCRSHEELCGALRPGVDGLLLEHRGRRAVFVPAMWQQLPRVEEFVAQLLHKGGIGVMEAFPGLTAQRFAAREIAEIEAH